MEQDEHLTEQKQQKFLTRSTARHLRRKRLKNARKAEKELLETVNDMVDSSNKEINITEESNKTEKVQLERLSVKAEDSYSLSRSAASLDLSRSKNKTEIQHIICKNISGIEKASHLKQNTHNQDHCKEINIEVDKIKFETIDNDSKKYSSYLPHSCRVINESKYETKETASQITNNEKVRYSRPSLTHLLPDRDLLDTLYSVPEKAYYTESNNTITTCSQRSLLPTNMEDSKTDFLDETRKQVKADREAKKAAKAAAKVKAKNKKVDNVKNEPPIVSDKILEKNAETKNCKNIKIISNNVQPSDVIAEIDTFKEKVETKVEEKSNAELRAERRAKQEAQRAAKQQLLPKKIDITVKNKDILESSMKTSVKKDHKDEDVHEINLFKHLSHERRLALFNRPTVNSDIHPAIIRLGVQYANKVIVGSNARCVALLAAIKQVIEDFEKPEHADFIRGLDANLQESVSYLNHCRPLAVSMQNALRHIKWQMTQSSSLSTDENKKDKLKNVVDTYIREQIELAGKAISITIRSKISNGNLILTYGYSSLIYKILLDAHAVGKQFRVIVVDGRPWLEGKEQLKRLVKHGIDCSYILINALSFIMPEVSKVFVGAHAILANGAVMSRVGTAQVALMAKAFNVPFLVACETHKSCERVQTDSIVYNELGDADQLVANQSNPKKTLLSNWRSKKFLNLLNITYDVTPADLVTAVVTELGILPCTSVPVILRIKPSEV